MVEVSMAQHVPRPVGEVASQAVALEPVDRVVLTTLVDVVIGILLAVVLVVVVLHLTGVVEPLAD